MQKDQKFRIIKGFYKDTIKNKTTKDLNIDKARVVMIDCDLKESTRSSSRICQTSNTRRYYNII